MIHKQIKSEYIYKELVDLNVQVFISSSSFEGRCFVIPNEIKDLKIKKYYFFNANEVELIATNAEKLCELSRDNSEKIDLNSDYPVLNFEKILELLHKITTENNNKSNVFIDITTFTHETLAILLKVLDIYKSIKGKIYLGYIGAKGYSINESEVKDKWLSKGIESIRTILGYSGYTDPTFKNHLVVLFGFESERTKRIIEEYEYDVISIGLGKVMGSIQSDHQKINAERHQMLMEEFPTANKFDFSLINPVEAKDDILSFLAQEHFLNLNTVISPLNNKISTIGACLAAFENEKIQLAYAKPLLYNINGYSEPDDIVYIYEFETSKD